MIIMWMYILECQQTVESVLTWSPTFCTLSQVTIMIMSGSKLLLLLLVNMERLLLRNFISFAFVISAKTADCSPECIDDFLWMPSKTSFSNVSTILNACDRIIFAKGTYGFIVQIRIGPKRCYEWELNSNVDQVNAIAIIFGIITKRHITTRIDLYWLIVIELRQKSMDINRVVNYLHDCVFDIWQEYWICVQEDLILSSVWIE